jgi:hypothetical protein
MAAVKAMAVAMHANFPESFVISYAPDGAAPLGGVDYAVASP